MSRIMFEFSIYLFVYVLLSRVARQSANRQTQQQNKEGRKQYTVHVKSKDFNNFKLQFINFSQKVEEE